MKILFIQRWVGTRLTGTETHLRGLANRLAARGHEVHVLTRGHDFAHLFSDQVRFWSVSRNWRESDHSYTLSDPRLFFHTVLFILKVFLKLAEMRLRRYRFDVVSVHFITEAIPAYMARLLFGWPFVYIFDGYQDSEARWARFANGHIAISNTIVRKCRNRFGYVPVYAPIGVEERYSPYGPKKSLAPGSRIVLSVSRMDREKRIHELIEASAILLSKGRNNLLFVFVGDGRDRTWYEALAHHQGIQKNAIFTGRVSNEELPKYYRSADVVVITEVGTANDEFWLVATEAMSSGVPVIAASTTGKLEVFGENGGLTFPPGQPSVLAERIIQVLDNRRLAAELASAGMLRMSEYKWDHVLPKYEKVYLVASKMRF